MRKRKRKMSSIRSSQGEDGGADENAMFPIMSLMIVLIPMLIGNMAFYHLKALQVNLPGVESNSEDQAQKKKKTKNLIGHLRIEKSYYQIDFINEDTGDVIDRVKIKDTARGLETIIDRMLSMKKRYKNFDLLMVSTNRSLKYEKLIVTLNKVVSPPKGAKETKPRFKIVLVPAGEL